MAKFPVLILSLIVIGTSQALRCKECKDVKCEDLEDRICPSEGTKSVACLIHEYKDAKNNKMVEKKCVSVDKNMNYVCNKTKGEEITCKTCKEDFCNNSGWIGGRGDAVLIAVVAAFALLKIIT